MQSTTTQAETQAETVTRACALCGGAGGPMEYIEDAGEYVHTEFCRPVDYPPPRPARRLHYSVWGAGARRLELEDSYCRWSPDEESRIAAVVRSLCRRTGLVCCAGPQGQGTSLDHGEASAHHYSCTLGRRCRGGGYTPIGEVWIAIPVGG